ncbi:MAG: hypothetical protein KC561_07565 [Myxococcales bacterium]|nr:hypothetical protein [Myxococcales bacterium]
MRLLPVCSVGLASLLSSIAFADVPPYIPEDQEFVTHRLQIENMADFPDYALLVFDVPQEGNIRAFRMFTFDTQAEQQLAHGASWDSLDDFGRPHLWLMPLSEALAYQQSASEEIAHQEAECWEGRGCSHASRFSPLFAAPQSAVDCGVELQMIHSRTIDEDTPPIALDAFRVVTASAEQCVVERVGDPPTASPGSVLGGPTKWWLLGALAGLGLALISVAMMKRKGAAGEASSSPSQASV